MVFYLLINLLMSRHLIMTWLGEGTNCQSSRLPPNGTKPDHIGLTATADARGSARPTIVSAHPPGSDDDPSFIVLDIKDPRQAPVQHPR